MQKCFLILVVLHFSIYGQNTDDTLKKYSLKLSIAFTDLEHYPNSLEVQQNYIRMFPDNEASFRKVFHSPPDYLYSESHEYISILSKLWDDSPELVGHKIIRLCIELKEWEADAIGYLQKTTMQFANDQYETFVSILKTSKQEENVALIRFLADVKNHSKYTYYQNFISKLKANNEDQIALAFEAERAMRIKSNY